MSLQQEEKCQKGRKWREVGQKVINKKEYLIMALMMLLAVPTYAEAPKIVTQTVKLFQEATTWLLLIIPTGAGLFLGWHAMQKSMSDDQSVIAEKNRLMKNVLIGAIIAESASGIATIILGFYA